MTALHLPVPVQCKSENRRLEKVGGSYKSIFQDHDEYSHWTPLALPSLCHSVASEALNTELPIYYAMQEDQIGLRKLDESRRLDLKTIPGYHMHFTLQEFDDVVIPYLTAGSQVDGGVPRM